MPIDVIGWASSHVGLVLTAIIGLVLVTWAYEAADEADDAIEAAQEFGSRTKSGLGSGTNVVLTGLVVMVGWAATTFATAGEALQFVVSLAPSAPVLTASAFTISLGAIGIADLIVIKWWHFALLSTAIVVLAFAYRVDLSAEGVGR
ncbi:hypothetical protein [Halobellus ordinarius]|uniref:hypothetical protein n=1 Tax=Halobellus ordinarius TaxID=3075120 RepID=UPI0028802FB0|nr:hypothetical protein [Halobellus sp. ZY16]